MKEYKNCFVGIPLPEEFSDDHSNLQRKVKGRCPSIDIVYRDIPHITLYYLDRRSEEDIFSVAEIILEDKRLLRDCVLKVGGFGYFGGHIPRILFLNVEAPKKLYKYQKNLSRKLQDYNTPGAGSYHPHLTLARIRDEKTRKMFFSTKDRLENLLNGVFWKFPLDKIVVYGKGAKKSKALHSRLKILSVR